MAEDNNEIHYENLTIDGVPVLRIQSPLGLTQHKKLRRLLDDYRGRFVLDLSETPHLDAACLAVLTGRYGNANGDGPVIYTSGRGSVCDAFQTTKAYTFLPVVRASVPNGDFTHYNSLQDVAAEINRKKVPHPV